MSDAPLFQNADEQEQVYAPQQVPDTAGRARLEGDADTGDTSAAIEPPSAAPVGSVGTSTSGVAAPPNVTDNDRGGAAGDPGTQARDPYDTRA